MEEKLEQMGIGGAREDKDNMEDLSLQYFCPIIGYLTGRKA